MSSHSCWWNRTIVRLEKRPPSFVEESAGLPFSVHVRSNFSQRKLVVIRCWELSRTLRTHSPASAGSGADDSSQGSPDKSRHSKEVIVVAVPHDVHISRRSLPGPCPELVPSTEDRLTRAEGDVAIREFSFRRWGRCKTSVRREHRQRKCRG